LLKTGQIFRSASLNNFVEEELSLLFEKAKIETIIDLRSMEEIQSKGYTNLSELNGDTYLKGTSGKNIRYHSVPVKPWTPKKSPPEIGKVTLKYVTELNEVTGYGFYEIFPRYVNYKLR
jgi:hypothetical protein